MKLARKNESGQIFVMVLILLAIGPLLILPMLRLSYSAQRFHQVVEIITLNDSAADSGVEFARYQIYTYPAEIRETPAVWNLVINGIDVHVTAEYDYDLAAYIITSTASRAQRSSTVEVVIVIDVGLFGKVVAVDGNLDIKDCQLVSDVGGKADVFVNGNVSISGSSAYPTLVDGDVTARGTVTLGNFATVTGNITQFAEVITFPPVDPQVHEDKAKAGGTYNGNYTLGTGTWNLGPLYINGNLSIPGHASQATTVTLQGTVYVTGSVTISRTTLKGFGDIIAAGTISMTRTTFDLTIVDFLPLTMSVNGNISVTGQSGALARTQTTMYAPEGLIDLSWAEVFGSVASPAVLMDHSTISYPAELRGRADLPGAGLDTVTYIFK